MPSGPCTPHVPVVHAPVKAAELGVDLVLLAAEQDTVPRCPRLLTLPAHTNQLLYVQEVVTLQKKYLIHLHQKIRFTAYIND